MATVLERGTEEYLDGKAWHYQRHPWCFWIEDRGANYDTYVDWLDDLGLPRDSEIMRQRFWVAQGGTALDDPYVGPGSGDWERDQWLALGLLEHERFGTCPGCHNANTRCDCDG